MKKLFLSVVVMALLSFSTAMAADGKLEIAGRVKSVDAISKEFVVETLEKVEYLFASAPSTEYEMKNTIFEKAEFEDLQAGQWVKIEYFPGSRVNVADEVKIYKE